MAARAGAMIGDAEFVQFHPTAIDVGLDPAPLATEALRGEGRDARQQPRRALHDGNRWTRRACPARCRGARRVHRDRQRARCLPRLPRGHRRAFRRRVPHRLRLVPEGRHRSGTAAHSGGAGGSLPYGRHRHGRARSLERAGPVGRRRGGLDRPARRQPARVQLTARGGGVRRPRSRKTSPISTATRDAATASSCSASPTTAPITAARVVPPWHGCGAR